MEVHWPTPTANYFCRCCNYTAFENEELLNQHKETEDHKEHQRKFLEGWCTSCQIHVGNLKSYEAHLKTPMHRMTKQLLDDANKRAASFWNKIHDIHLQVINNPLEQMYKPNILPAHLFNPGLISPHGQFQSNNTINSNNQQYLDNSPPNMIND